VYLDVAAYRAGKTASLIPDLDADLRGRDFTINAIAYDVRRGVLLDPLEGGADLRARRLRAGSDSAMDDDPVRVLRGVRLAAALGFQIERGTREQMKKAASGLGRVSVERQRDELFKILEGPKPDASVRALEMLGVLPHVLPELEALKGVEQSTPHVHDVWNHTLAVLQSLEGTLAALRVGYKADETDDLFTGLLTLRLGRYREKLAVHLATPLNPDRSLRGLLFFIALFHDVCKPQTRTVEPGGRIRFFDHDQQGAEVAARRGEMLHLSNDEIERLRVVIKNHMRFHFHTSRMDGESKPPSRKSIYRFFRDSGPAGPDLVLLGLADLRATQGSALRQETWGAALDVARILLENYWEKPEESVAPPRLLDGRELMEELGIQPGPQLGKLIEAIREAQAVGKVSSREAALQYARSWLAGSRSDTI
jgi:putative nucleotidyltransferase with HDIG domain